MKFVCFHLISWIKCGEAKIRVAIRDHIQFLNLLVPQFHQNTITNPKITSIPYQFGVRGKILDLPFTISEIYGEKEDQKFQNLSVCQLYCSRDTVHVALFAAFFI